MLCTILWGPTRAHLCLKALFERPFGVSIYYVPPNEAIPQYMPKGLKALRAAPQYMPKGPSLSKGARTKRNQLPSGPPPTARALWAYIAEGATLPKGDEETPTIYAQRALAVLWAALLNICPPFLRSAPKGRRPLCFALCRPRRGTATLPFGSALRPAKRETTMHDKARRSKGKASGT